MKPILDSKGRDQRTWNLIDYFVLGQAIAGLILIPVLILLATLAMCSQAHAQLPPGPNLRHGIPFMFVPRPHIPAWILYGLAPPPEMVVVSPPISPMFPGRVMPPPRPMVEAQPAPTPAPRARRGRPEVPCPDGCPRD